MKAAWGFAIPFLLLLTASTAIRLEETPAPVGPEAGSKLLEALSKLEARPLDELWPALEELKKAYPPGETNALDHLSEKVFELGEKPKLAGGVLLLSRGERRFQGSGQVAIQQIAHAGRDKPVRIAAIRLLRTAPRIEPAYLVLKGIVDAPEEAEIRIEACLTLWALDNHHSVLAPLVRMLEEKDPGARSAAALALAETGYFQPPVDMILRALRQEPSDRGKRADILLRLSEKGSKDRPGTSRALSSAASSREEAEAEGRLRKPERGEKGDPSKGRDEGPGGAWSSLIEEVIQVLREHSLYRDKTRSRDLYIAAVKGMVSSLDEYSAFQDPDTVQQIEAGRLGIYWGIGARLFKPKMNGPLVVVKAFYGGPAFLAGLRTADRILEVNGVTTHDHPIEEMERLTAGKPGDSVQVLVNRWGWEASRMYSLERGAVEVPLVRTQLFPGEIGYIKLQRFGRNSAAELEKMLDSLEALGLQALILDLRGNPGGDLDQAVKIVDLFVGEKDHPIVSERGPDGAKESFPNVQEKPFHPMMILVNGSSASSSEVVAGALQDFQRAIVLGQRTFGKGVKQTSMSLSPLATTLLEGESKLLLTTRYLYLPLGRSIQGDRGKNGQALPGRRGGIEPDILVDDERGAYQGRQPGELARVQYSSQMDEYVHKNFQVLKDLFREGRLPDPSKCPDFEELYRAIETPPSRSDVGYALRSLVRQHLEDERGEEFPSDFRDDRQLQRAILEALVRLGRDPGQIPEYKEIEIKSSTEKSRN